MILLKLYINFIYIFKIIFLFFNFNNYNWKYNKKFKSQFGFKIIAVLKNYDEALYLKINFLKSL